MTPDSSGQLIVQTGAPNIHAYVALSGPNGEALSHTAPFALCGLAPGPWRLEASVEGYQTVRTTVLIRSKTTSSKTMTFRPASRVTVEGGGRIRWADSEGNEASVSLPFELFRPNLDGLRLKGEGRSSGVAPRDGVVVAIREGTEMAVRWGRPGIDALGREYAVPKALTMRSDTKDLSTVFTSHRRARNIFKKRWFDVAPVSSFKELRWKVRSVVIHAHKEGKAQLAAARWLKAGTSRHFVIEPDGSVLQILDVLQQIKVVGSRLDENAIHISVSNPQGRLSEQQHRALGLLLGTLSGMFPRVSPAFPSKDLGTPLVDPRSYRGWMTLDQVQPSESVLTANDRNAIENAYTRYFRPRPAPKMMVDSTKHAPSLAVVARPETATLRITSPTGAEREHSGPFVVCEPAPGPWTVLASAPGFAPERRSASLDSNKSVLLSVPLARTGQLTVEGRKGQAAELVMPSGKRRALVLPARLRDIPEGVYRVSVDRSSRQLPVYALAIRVHAGQHARLSVPDVDDPTLPFIRVAGVAYPLPASLVVRRYDMPGAMSFYRAQTRLGKRGRVFADRRLPNGQVVEDLAQASEVTRMVVLHADVMPDTKSMFKLLVSRHLSTHFAIDWDGTIHQLLDPVDTAFAAAEVNPYSIHIDLNNVLPNLVKKPKARPIPGGHPRFRDMTQARFRRPKSPRMSINGRDVMSYGYNGPQYRSLAALMRLLTGLFERIEPRVPRDGAGRVPLDYFNEAEDFEGVVAHWHLTPRRWDPGPGFDWQRLRDDLSGRRIQSGESETSKQP